MPSIRRRWTVSQVRELTDETRPWPRYELIDGELLVTPSPGFRHQFAVSELAFILRSHVERNPVGAVLLSPSDLELRTETITQPDVFVVPAGTRAAGDQLQWSDVKSLLLAIEVLSPSSLRADRVVKRDLYLEHGVAEYWIVDLDARVVERWTPSQATPEIVRDRLAWSPGAGEPLVIDLRALFERVTGKRSI
jgi:Uma2 family endonuclease